MGIKFLNQSRTNRSKKIFSYKVFAGCKNVCIYEINNNGSIRELEKFMDIPSDENFLNTSLRESDELFGELLEIQDLCAR